MSAIYGSAAEFAAAKPVSCRSVGRGYPLRRYARLVGAPNRAPSLSRSGGVGVPRGPRPRGGRRKAAGGGEAEPGGLRTQGTPAPTTRDGQSESALSTER